MICFADGIGCIEYATKLPGHWRWSKRKIAIIIGGQRKMVGGRPYMTYKDDRGVINMLPDVGKDKDKDAFYEPIHFEDGKECPQSKIHTHKVYANEKTPENTQIRYFLKGNIVCSFIAFQQTFKVIR
jgi:hypothetical protein